MTRIWIFATLLAGCFYTEPLNQRPSLEIHRQNPGVPLSRGEIARYTAAPDDPDGDSVALTWRAYACHGSQCDAVEFDSGADTTFETMLPRFDANGDTYDTLEVRLEGRDALGATARPSQTDVVNLVDAEPEVVLRADPRHHYVVDMPLGIYARVADADDGPDKVGVTWNAYAPPMAMANDTLVDRVAPVDDDPATYKQYAKTFTPNAIGDWTIDVVGTDPLGATDHDTLMLHVDTDHPPCLAQWDPDATSAPGTTIPMSEPTLFQVLVVADDLDPFPSVPNDPVLGTTEFHWSIVPPGGSRQQLTGVTGAGVALDPDAYTLGDLVELRVEIQDRKHTLVNCPVGDLTCSVISDPSCLQRLTWRVEVR
ncbi:MAG: hypothetical protein ABI678_19025 [Kofleriaceae bacterium]